MDRLKVIAYSAGTTIRRIMRLLRVSGQRGRQNHNCVVQKVSNVHHKTGRNMMKVNETHDHAVYEEIKVLHYFRFAAEGLIFFLLISILHILGKLCHNFV